MDAKELRIGNWITWKSDSDIEQVKDIQTRGLKYPVINRVNIVDAKPIPLTEEWLLKFGFEKIFMSFQKFSFVIDKWTDGELMYNWLGGNIEVKHVHQLQNLYFALTGEELQSKEL